MISAATYLFVVVPAVVFTFALIGIGWAYRSARRIDIDTASARAGGGLDGSPLTAGSRMAMASDHGALKRG